MVEQLEDFLRTQVACHPNPHLDKAMQLVQSWRTSDTQCLKFVMYLENAVVWYHLQEVECAQLEQACVDCRAHLTSRTQGWCPPHLPRWRWDLRFVMALAYQAAAHRIGALTAQMSRCASNCTRGT